MNQAEIDHQARQLRESRLSSETYFQRRGISRRYQKAILQRSVDLAREDRIARDAARAAGPRTRHEARRAKA